MVNSRTFEAITEITVLAPDHPRLLSIIAGSCAAAGANIVDAQIYTTTDGRALDTIFISREFQQDEDEERRAARVGKMIEDVLAGKVRLPEMIANRAQAEAPLQGLQRQAAVDIDNELSDEFSVIEVEGLDRPGLLFELTRALADLNLNIASAHIATFGERVIDMFYVPDLVGHKITAPGRQAKIIETLVAVFDPAGAKSDEPWRLSGRAARIERSCMAGGLVSKFTSVGRRRSQAASSASPANR